MDIHQQNERRVCILVMDSFGIGESEDAWRYQDEGANTFKHILKTHENTRNRSLDIPHLTKLGIFHAAMASCGENLIDLKTLPEPIGYYGYGVEKSLGKDTPSGHWELMGVPVLFDWGYFPNQPHCFPKKMIDTLIKKANLSGVLGEKHASGTEIIEEFGEEHCLSGKPIVYTSADSVFQIAAHEEFFGLERLYHLCEIAREILDEYQIGRVIARPFITQDHKFIRTPNRKDFAIPPPQPTLLDDLKKAGNHIIAIGKIADIFAHRGITETLKGKDNNELFNQTIECMKTASNGSLIFTNFIDFDSSYGHRRDTLGYADALEAFDKKLPELEQVLRPGDRVFIVADHGCDPTFKGSDHTREHIPILCFGPDIGHGYIGRRESFADVGQSIAQYLSMPTLQHGIAFDIK